MGYIYSIKFNSTLPTPLQMPSNCKRNLGSFLSGQISTNYRLALAFFHSLYLGVFAMAILPMPGIMRWKYILMARLYVMYSEPKLYTTILNGEPVSVKKLPMGFDGVP